MSVILYEDEKFLKVASSLKLQGQDIAHLWLYPKGWDQWGGMDKTIDKFVNGLRNANIDASNERYKEKEPFRVLDYSNGTMPLTQMELIKSLQGISYNSVESEKFNRTKDRLFKVIYFLMSQVINSLPEYEKAKTW